MRDFAAPGEKLSDKLLLTLIAGPKAGTTFAFEMHDTLLVGRMDDCHVRLPDDKMVSRHHFLLEVNPPEARVRDLGSLHGTYINDRKYGGREKDETPEEGARRDYPQVDLRDGDIIGVGKTRFQVRIEKASASAGPLSCPRCGKDLSVETGQGGASMALCQDCRKLAEHDPRALLIPAQHKPRQDRQTLQLADYDIGKQLGAGGMGAVYLAHQKQTGEQVAVKVMLAKTRVNDHARAQFLREIESTRALHHPQVVRFLGHGVEGDLFYFLLEYCEGGSVADLMKRRGGRLPADEARPILLHALEGLAFVHKQGFVHRDLKPQNILLTGRVGHWSARISDLGLAKSFEQAGLSGMTATGSFAGSFPFMPREQVVNFKRVQPSSDVWAMGATCYYVLAGSYPREHRPGQDPILVLLQEEIIPLRQRISSVPTKVAEVIDRALALKESERYQQAGEIYEALVNAWS